MEKAIPFDGYYIGTGQKNGYYTLRQVWKETCYRQVGFGMYESYTVDHDNYVKRLSRDPEDAVRRAEKYTGIKGIPVLVSKLEAISRSPVDHNVIRFGKKHFGKTVQEVFDTDKEYLLWIAENMESKSHEKTLEIIRELTGAELDTRKKEREVARAAEEALRVKRVKKLTGIVNELHSNGSNFAISIGNDLLAGRILSPKAIGIVADIVGRMQGRRNSKVYKETHDKVLDIFEEVQTM